MTPKQQYKQERREMRLIIRNLLSRAERYDSWRASVVQQAHGEHLEARAIMLANKWHIPIDSPRLITSIDQAITSRNKGLYIRMPKRRLIRLLSQYLPMPIETEEQQ